MKTVLLRDVARIERGGVDPAEVDGATRYIGLEHIERGGRITGTETVASAAIKSTKFRFTPEHLLFGKLRPNLGKVARPIEAGVCSTDILPVLPGPNLDRDYLFHYLTQPKMVDFAASRASGANLPRLSPTSLGEFEIPLPPLDEQRRIAAILDQAHDIRGMRNQSQGLVGDFTRSLFVEFFGDPVRNPQGWPTFELGELGESGLSNGAYFPKDAYGSDGVEMVHMSDVFYDKVQRGDLRRVRATDSEISKYGITCNDLLIARRSLNYSGAAKPCLIPQSAEPLLYESSLIKLTPKADAVRVEYLFYLLRNEKFRRGSVAKIVTGTTIFGVSQSNLSRVQVPIPPLSIQDRFVQELAKLDKLADRQRASAEFLDSLFPSLQYRAFAGEL